jgi:hypothetical protein
MDEEVLPVMNLKDPVKERLARQERLVLATGALEAGSHWDRAHLQGHGNRA